MDLINGVIEARAESTIPEHSPVGEPQSNGLVERAVRSTKDLIQTLKLALQKNISCRIPPQHSAMAWLVQHAGAVIFKFQVSRDSNTAYEHMMGKPCREEVT